MHALSYKEEHEAFVSNLKGTSVGCILACFLHIPAVILLLKLIQKKARPRILRDMVYLVIPLLLSLTVLADYSYVSLIIIAIAEIYTLQLQKLKYESDVVQDVIASEDKKKSYISLFKGDKSIPLPLFHFNYCIIL
jgi:hypothetical protein